MLLSLLLFISIASVDNHPTAATERKIILDPTHGAPGTLVTFQGVDWYLPGVSPCRVDGKPVKIDRYAVCEVKGSSLPLVTVIATGGTVFGQSSLEPAGTFVVAKIPPGTYTVTVTVNNYGLVEQPFTVDGTVMSTTTETGTTIASSISQTQTTVQSTVTMTLTTTTVEYHEVLDYSIGRSMLLGLGAMIAVLVLILIIVLRRKPVKNACDEANSANKEKAQNTLLTDKP